MDRGSIRLWAWIFIGAVSPALFAQSTDEDLAARAKRVEAPQSRCLAGVARGDITPPVGIYHRMWGAATHDKSTGVHRPLTATVLYLADLESESSAEEIKVVVALDHCLLGTGEMNELLVRVSAGAEVPRKSLVVFFSHTHAAGLMGHERVESPGGEQIVPYLEKLANIVTGLIRTSRSRCRPARVVYGVGRCGMAANRDYFDSDAGEYVCGFNPAGKADDTVLVGRVTDDGGCVLATVVNYACHPTTLAWQNTLISPDYLGAMREVVEQATAAPCLFIQGASGDMGPRDGFVGDVEVADRNGRQLGYAVLSALESLPKPGLSYQYDGSVISGATLGIWKYVPVTAVRARELCVWQSRSVLVPLAYRDDLPDADDLRQQREMWQKREAVAKAVGDRQAARDARAMAERMTRALGRVRDLPPGGEYPYPVHLWRMGDAVWVGLDGEHYNLLQRELRRRFPRRPIVVGTLANGSNIKYVLNAASYGKGLYQENVSVLARGSLEKLTQTISAEIRAMTTQD